MSSKVADLITAVLRNAGVERIYGVVGDSLNGITDSLRRRGDIDWIHVRHEEVAAFAAGAEAGLTGGLAVCAGSCGPGNTHLINGLFDCQRTRVPVLAIAAHIPSAEIGRGYFQETRPEELFRACSDYCELVSHPSQLPGVLETAIRSALGRRSVSVVVIPGDVALEPIDAPVSPPAGLRIAAPTVQPNGQDIEALATMLSGGERVTLLCGRGCEGAHDEVIALAAALRAPIVHALGGKEHVEWDNAFDVGMTGLIGFSSGYHAMMECDVLLMLGTDFPYRQFLPADARIAQVDVRPENLGRRAPLALAVVGDVAATVTAVLPKISTGRDGAHLERCQAHHRHARSGLDALETAEPADGPIHPQYLMRVLSDQAADDAVFTFDVGTVTVWAARHLRMNGRRRMVGSLNHGSMANALPQAIGAQACSPGRQVISLSGDGGLTMLMGDLLTLVQQRLPVKVVVFNNGSLGFVALEMRGGGFLEYGTDLENPDFAAVARAAGLHGIRVTRPGDLEAAVPGFLDHDGPALLDVVTNKSELSVPPKITGEQAKGFGLWGMRAVLSGRGDEVLELLHDRNAFRALLGR